MGLGCTEEEEEEEAAAAIVDGLIDRLQTDEFPEHQQQLIYSWRWGCGTVGLQQQVGWEALEGSDSSTLGVS